MRISRQAVAIVLTATACSSRAPGPDVQIVGESTRLRAGDPVPARTPWFDGASVSLIAARGETLGVQVLHRGGGPVTLAFAGGAATDVVVHGFAVEHHRVTRPSTDLYGGSQGAGDYPDALTADAAPATDPAYFELVIAADAAPGTRTGELVVGGKRLAVTLAIAPITLPPIARAPTVWAYDDLREFVTTFGTAAGEHQCVELFRRAGVLLSPDLPVGDYAAHRDQLAGMTYIPAVISADPAHVGDDVRAWIAATAGTGQVPFAIPIDEPHGDDAQRKVRALADAARAAGAGPGRLLFAVTDTPRPAYGDAVDLYISWLAVHLAGDRGLRFTYNGAPPFAGSMVLDAETPGLRTWGWIGWRWHVPLWYAWHATYWHDRYNLHGAALPGRALDVARDPVSFDDGEDHGNLDGVLVLPGTAAVPCRPTLRLAALRRGLEDRALLELAATCAPADTAAVAAALVPTALGDAPPHGHASWPADEGAWELARRQLIAIASRCPDR